MVVRIKTGKSIRGALSYNETKVSAGEAELLLASRFACEISDLGFTQKLTRFRKLNDQNPKVKTNTLHISLNFSPHDKLDNEKMQQIASDYMQRIGFGEQPYLVYKHNDAGHPHLHIVTTNIKPGGSPINLHNIGRLQSDTARKTIEKEFDLIPAESVRREVSLPLSPINTEKALYGQEETKSKISGIVCEVTSNYHFSSLDELNAILKQYNIVADPGRLGTRMHTNKGLVYSMLDKNGNKVGVPIKASAVYTSPTLKNLERKFEKEKNFKKFYSQYANKILEDFLKKPINLTEAQLKEWFAKKKLNYELIRNQQGTIMDIRFIDNARKVVLHCEDLSVQKNELLDKFSLVRQNKLGIQENVGNLEKETSQIFSRTTLKLIDHLSSPEYDPTAQTPEFLRRKRKRKRT